MASANHLSARPFFREDAHPVDAAFVRTLSARSLADIYDTLQVAAAAYREVQNRPGVQADQPLFAWFDRAVEHCDQVCNYAAEEAERRALSGREEDLDFLIGIVADFRLRQCREDAVPTLARLLNMVVPDAITAASS